jgi:hypothetical protein
VCELLEFMSPDSDTPNSYIYREREREKDYIKEGESISKVNFSIESRQPFSQMAVSDNIANFIRKSLVLHVQTCSNAVLRL